MLRRTRKPYCDHLAVRIAESPRTAQYLWQVKRGTGRL